MTDLNLAAHAATKPATQEDLTLWFNMTQQLDQLKVAEIALRKRIFTTFFKSPVEGTNKVPLTEGWILKADHKINRSVDIASLTNAAAAFKEAGIATEDLIKYKPELVIVEYRKLDDDTRKVFDQILVIKEGSPQLEIVKPKRG